MRSGLRLLNPRFKYTPIFKNLFIRSKNYIEIRHWRGAPEVCVMDSEKKCKYDYLTLHSLLSDDLRTEINWKAKLFNLVHILSASFSNIRKLRYILWKTCKLADRLPFWALYAQKMEKLLNLLFRNRHSSQQNGLKNIIIK